LPRKPVYYHFIVSVTESNRTAASGGVLNPTANKITNADNNIIIEYIKSILRIKKHIIIDIEYRINYLKETPDELNKLLYDIKSIILQN
jgi:hypothetical protein